MSEDQAEEENARIATDKAAGVKLMASVKTAQPGYGAPKLGCTIAKQQGLDVMVRGARSFCATHHPSLTAHRPAPSASRYLRIVG